MYNIPATEFLVDSSFIKSNHINTNTRCVIVNANNDVNIQILQKVLRRNKVITYKTNTNHKLNGTPSWKCIQKV